MIHDKTVEFVILEVSLDEKKRIVALVTTNKCLPQIVKVRSF